MVTLPMGQPPFSGTNKKNKRRMSMPMVQEPTSGDQLDRIFNGVFIGLILLAIVVGGLAWMASS